MEATTLVSLQALQDRHLLGQGMNLVEQWKSNCGTIDQPKTDFGGFYNHVKVRKCRFSKSLQNYSKFALNGSISDRADVLREIVAIIKVFGECCQIEGTYRNEGEPDQSLREAGDAAGTSRDRASIQAPANAEPVSGRRKFGPSTKSLPSRGSESRQQQNIQGPPPLQALPNSTQNEGEVDLVPPPVGERQANSPTLDNEKRLQPLSLVIYSPEDKKTMDDKLKLLLESNTVLEFLVNLLCEKEPLGKIRNGLSPPTLWDDNKSNREELVKFEQAMLDDGNHDELGLRLEFEYSDTLHGAKRKEFDRGLDVREPHVYFRLLYTYTEELYTYTEELLIARSISRGNTPHWRAANEWDALKESEQRSWYESHKDIGKDTDKFVLRHIRRKLGVSRLSSLIPDIRSLSLQDRVNIASHIAVAYLQLADLDTNKMERNAGTYMISVPPRKNGVWLEGVVGARIRLDLPQDMMLFREDRDELEAAAPRELGRLLFQIFNFSLDLKQEKEMTEHLVRSGGICMPIIQACFLEPPQPPRHRFHIIEEVAHALVNYMTNSANEYQADEKKFMAKLTVADASFTTKT
ncbi:hypothetical protein MY10362_000352 [Beauveria mimosiformis]